MKALGSTVDVDEAMAAMRAAVPLPFAAPRSALRAGASLTGTVDVEAAMAEMRAAPAIPAPVPAVDLSKAAQEAGAFERPLAQAPSGLSLEQYAALCAEMAARPEQAREIAARYQIANDAAWAALRDAWQAWLARDHEVWQRFRTLEAHYREWFAKR